MKFGFLLMCDWRNADVTSCWISNQHLGRQPNIIKQTFTSEVTAVNCHLPRLCNKCTRAAGCEVRHFRGPRHGSRAQVSKMGEKKKRKKLEVFLLVSIRHVHRQITAFACEKNFSSTTDTLWLSGSQWTGTTLAMTPIEGSQSKDSKPFKWLRWKWRKYDRRRETRWKLMYSSTWVGVNS